MRKILLFLAFSVFGAKTALELPHYFARWAGFQIEGDGILEMQRPQYKLKKMIVSHEKEEEIVSFSAGGGHLWCVLSCCNNTLFEQASQDKKTMVMTLERACECGELCGKGSVLFSERGCRGNLVLHTPQDEHMDVFRFGQSNKKSNRLCSCHAQSAGFNINRFLYKYNDGTFVFVKAEANYTNMDHVVVSWGIANIRGAQDVRGSHNFEFNPCSKCEK